VKLKLNMKNVGSMFDPVPDDVYRFRITAIEDREGPAGPYCYVTLTIAEGELAETRAVGDNWSFAEKALWKTKKSLEAVSGVEWDEDDMDFDSDEFVNMEVYGLTAQETYPKKDGTGEGTKSVISEYYSIASMSDPKDI